MTSYPPPHYNEPDLARQLQLAREQPLATFAVADDAGRPYLTPLPLVLAQAEPEADGRLQFLGHLDANNPAAAWIRDGRPAVAVFHGPSVYISPDDYVSSQLPTYNYQQVHVHGTLRRLTDRAAIKSDLRSLTEAMEGPKGWTLPEDDPRVEAYVPHIVAFRLHVERVDGRFKLSQDKREKDKTAADEKMRRVG